MVNNELLRRVGIKENFVESKRKAFKESYFDIAIKYKKATISMENTNLKNSINEIITFKSGYAEGFGEKVKEGWDTFIEKLKKLWNDFIDGCQALIKKITGFFLKRKVEKIKKKYFQISHLDLSKDDITIWAADSILDLIDGKQRTHYTNIDAVVINLKRTVEHLKSHLINLFKNVDKIIKNPDSLTVPVTEGLLDVTTTDFVKYRQELKDAVEKIAKEEKKAFVITKNNLAEVKKTAKELMKIFEDEYAVFSGQLSKIDEMMDSNKDAINKLKVTGYNLPGQNNIQNLYEAIEKIQVEVVLNIKEISKEYSTFLACVDIRTNLDKIHNGKQKPMNKATKNAVDQFHREANAQAQRDTDTAIRMHNDAIQTHNQMFNM